MRTTRAHTGGAQPRKQRPVRMSAIVTEAHIQQTITELLQMDGWRAIRTDPVSDRSRGKGFGEIAMPDYLYVRYAYVVCNERSEFQGWHREDAQVLWIEFKRPGKQPTPAQLAWHAAEEARGALVLVVGTEETWWDDFKRWYALSGLQRR